MDPEGNYESRLSYTAKSSRDINVGDGGGDPLSEAPEDPVNTIDSKPFGLSASEHKHEEKERAYDYFGASAPPLPGVPVPVENTSCNPSPPDAAEEDTCTCKPSPVSNRETKAFSPPDEPVLDSVVVPINAGAIDALPVALPVVTNATGGGLDAMIPLPNESPETAQSSSDGLSATKKEPSRTQRKTCSTRKILLLCLIVVLVAGLAATLTILLWPDQSPDDQEDPYIYISDDNEETMEPSPTGEPTYESTAKTSSGTPFSDTLCSKDVKLCNDGTSVPRDPSNNCYFPPCPMIPIPSCTVNGLKYTVGSTYTAPDGCNTCACIGNGEITCTTTVCPRDQPELPEEPEPAEKPSKKEMYSAYYNTNNRDGPMNCCEQKSQACCRCCKDECAMKEKGDLDDIPSCKRECREYYGRDTCSRGDEGPFDCCTSESKACCRCCMDECGKRYKGDLDLIEQCISYVCRDGYYGRDVC